MAWLDDRIWAHPKTSGLSPRAFRTFVFAIAYSSGFGLYGVLHPAHQKLLGSTPGIRRELVDAGLWEESDEHPGAIEIHDWDEHNDRRDAALEARRFADRRRQQVKRDPELRAIVRSRDGDFCRYCAREVDWKDRKTGAGGTYDHVDPHGDNAPENLVVSCRGCNSQKGQRTPKEAGMTVIPIKVGSRSDQGRDLDPGSGADQGRDLESRPRARTPARERPMTSDGVTKEQDQLAGPTTSTTDHDDNGLPFEIKILVARLMEHIGDHADNGTRHIIETYARDLPEASLAKALESSEHTAPDDRAAYIVGVLASERDDPEPGPRSELPRAGAAS